MTDTFEHPQTGEKIRVAKKDFLTEMTWEQAMEACAALGNGWRLPTIDELNEMYEHREALGGFSSCSYWSSSEDTDDYAWDKSFDDGSLYDGSKLNPYCVRAVRTV
jgi:hypothetical protein